MKKIYLLIVLCSLVVSCTEIVNFNVQREKEQPVIFAYLNPDSNIRVFLFKSSRMGSSQAHTPLTKASFELLENGVEVIEQPTFENGGYLFACKPNANSKYKVNVQHPEVDSFSAEDSIPKKPIITEAELIPNSTYNVDSEGFMNKIRFIIDDPRHEENYYEFFSWGVKKWYSPYELNADTTFNYLHVGGYTSDNPILQAENLLQYKPQYGLIVSDELFNGEKKIMSFEFDGFDYEWASRLMDFTLYLGVRSISKSYYEYKKSWLIHQNTRSFQEISDLKDIASYRFMVEPEFVFSNVDNGFGNILGYNQETLVVFSSKVP